MKRKRELARQYEAALRKHLKQGPRASLQPAQGLGRRAITIGLETLELARIHEQALSGLILPGDSAAARGAKVQRAGNFFAEIITPIEKTHRTALEAEVHLGQMNEALRLRNLHLAVSARRLRQEIVKRKSAEEALRRSEMHYERLLEQSRQMQEQLRLLSRQLLLAQEEERKKISRELHDVIAQTLTSINVRLASLKKAATLNTKGLERNIARTQELVEHSVNIVHQFARELRPTVLDDLGLIPALHTFMKSFRERTGIQVSLSVPAAVNKVSSDKRTTLFRVAQEALANVASHANASHAEVKIRKSDGIIWMSIRDNGKGFEKERISYAKKNRRLGLVGMRERLEMVGGQINIISALGRGTTIQAQVPFSDNHRGAD